jgi:hypothetical protein
LLHAFIDLHGKNLGGKSQNQAKDQAQRTQNDHGENDGAHRICCQGRNITNAIITFSLDLHAHKP